MKTHTGGNPPLWLAFILAILATCGEAQALDWPYIGLEPTNDATQCLARALGSTATPPTCTFRWDHTHAECVFHGWPLEGAKFFSDAAWYPPDDAGEGRYEANMYFELGSGTFAYAKYGGFSGLYSYDFASGAHATCTVYVDSHGARHGSWSWQ